uniref:Uncharacterized protein n=2 Tax=Anopheles stephensi TaxID=30069 RepID=A0A182XZG0_ANOST
TRLSTVPIVRCDRPWAGRAHISLLLRLAVCRVRSASRWTRRSRPLQRNRTATYKSQYGLRLIHCPLTVSVGSVLLFATDSVYECGLVLSADSKMFSGKLLCFGVLAFVVAGTAMADETNQIDVDAIRDRLPANLPIPSMEEVEKMLRDKCNAAGAPADAYDNAKEAAKTFVECGQGLIDIAQFQQEVEAAKPTGDLDTVFNKYCRKRSTLIECVNTLANAVDPCLEAEEKVFKTSGLDIFKNLLNFVCHKDGDQIALFIAEQGPECFLEQKNDLIACVNETFSGYVPETSLTSIPKLVIGPKQCEDFNKLQTCMVRELEQCDESTPANLVESLFRYVRKGSPCANNAGR